MFLDFLKAEWKTLIISAFIIVTLVGGFYWSISDPIEEVSEHSRGCLVRGQSLGGIALGKSMDEIRVLRGDPVKMEDKGSLGMVWEYGDVRVYFRGGDVESVFSQEGVESLSACFLEAKVYLRREIGRGIFFGGEEWMQYSSGWMVKLKKDDDKKGDEVEESILGVGVYYAHE